MSFRIRILFISVITVGAAGLLVWFGMTRPHLTAAERGRRLAERIGCFSCHGPEGSGGISNFGRSDKTVPNFRDDVMMFAHGAGDIRQWITNGMTTAKSNSESWKEERTKGALKMPAFGNRLSKSEIEDLVAFVTLESENVQPEDTLALRGMNLTDSLGCIGCHGPAGALSRPNRGSFKGYVASWQTSDFLELVRDRNEFDQWVENGISDRMKGNMFARFFLHRATLKMPSFKSHLKPGDLDALWVYINWCRTQNQK